jgi:hypothetical protein
LSVHLHNPTTLTQEHVDVLERAAVHDDDLAHDCAPGDHRGSSDDPRHRLVEPTMPDWPQHIADGPTTGRIA